MRALKFRCWDIDNKEFVYISETTDGEIWINNGISTVTMPEHKTPYEQYIGLRDTNGKEIYEGDIVEVFSTDEYVMGFEGIYRVYFDNSWLSYQMYKVHSSYSSITEPFEPEMSTNIEVIGNIHENKELLGGKK